MAQNPSNLVAAPLQNHVHLISGHRFPHLPSLNLEQAYRYLIDAPTIVKQTAPMAWQYVQPPPDGTAWLEWIAPRNNEYRFASDGYVWADPEQTYRQEFGGYTIEWMSHTLGYRPNYENVATHARTRFHFVQKNPGVNAPPPDPSLWIVHYHQTDQGRMMPVANIPVPQVMRQIINDRRMLEMQGRLDKRDFMLHDREHWPTITVPSGNAQMQQAMLQQQQQQAGMYQHNAMMQQQQMAASQRFPQQQPYAHGGQGGPPAKRPKTSGPSGLPGSSDGVHDGSIEEEENQLLDYFDHLTPRDISMARYIQHHRWMEEVFSSPYPSSHLVPPDLGLGLMGELKGLTEGILDPPSVDDVTGDDLRDDPSKPHPAREAQPFTNLKKEQIDEFNRRVEKHLADGQAEIEKMKKEHAEKMAEWKKTKTLMQAEKRLRYATWEGHENAVQPVYRLEVPPAPTNGHHTGEEENKTLETVEDVVKDVERLLGVKVLAHKDATMVQRGGLEREEEVERDGDMVDEGKEDGMQDVQAQQQQQSGMGGVNGGMGNMHYPTFEQQQQQSVSAAQQQVPNISVEMPSSSVQLQQPQQEALDNAAAAAQPQQSSFHDNMSGQHDHHDGLDDMEDMGEMGDTTSLMDMDVDVDTGDIDFVHHDEDEFGEDPTAPSREHDQTQPEELVPAVVEERPSEPVVDVAAATPPVLEQSVSGGVEELQQQEAGEIAVADADSLQQDQLQPELPVLTEESAIPAMAADASLGNEPDVSAIADEQQPDALPPRTQPPNTADPAAGDVVPAVDDTAVTATTTGGEGGNLFDDGTFDDLPGMGGDGDDNDGDDGLIDFDGGMGMEDSAFGDALHGMDTRTPDVGSGGGDDGDAGDAGQSEMGLD